MLDWDDLRFFLAIAREGKLSAAARDLRVVQSTVGRRLTSLEASLGVRLLNRTPDGYVLTLAGESVLAQIERVEAQIASVERSVGGRDKQLAGVVRVSCCDALASHVLAPGLAALNVRYPGIVIELLPHRRELSLAMRDADVSVQTTRPAQHDLVVRRIGCVGFGLYASPAYLERHGEPDFAAGSPGHRLIMQIDDIQGASQMGWFAEIAARASVGLQTSSHEAAVAAALRAGGLACLARFRADRETGLIRLPVPSPVPDADLWLTVHRDTRQMPRVRVTLAAIAETVRAPASLHLPQTGALRRASDHRPPCQRDIGNENES